MPVPGFHAEAGFEPKPKGRPPKFKVPAPAVVIELIRTTPSIYTRLPIFVYLPPVRTASYEYDPAVVPPKTVGVHVPVS